MRFLLCRSGLGELTLLVGINRQEVALFSDFRLRTEPDEKYVRRCKLLRFFFFFRPSQCSNIITFRNK